MLNFFDIKIYLCLLIENRLKSFYYHTKISILHTIININNIRTYRNNMNIWKIGQSHPL